jgi:nucleoside-diphosphate-sugar epimerase
MKILFIGGTGVISSACSQLCLERGFDLHLLNRGQSVRGPASGAKVIQADIYDRQAAFQALEGKTFDVVVNWIAYNPEHVEADLDLFRGRVGQYIFISSTSVYQRPPPHLPVSESTPQKNPDWGYAQAKIACEERLVKAYQDENFPLTIVRPSHTYDRTRLPFLGRWTVVDRMRQGKPVIVHGDGTSIWSLTHHQDFARAFVPLLGHPGALGEAFHISSDELLTWNQIFQIVGRAAGAEPEIVHVPSTVIARYDKEWGENLVGDKRHSIIFDCTKIRRFARGWQAEIPYHQGARQVIDWFEQDPDRQTLDPVFDRLCDRILEDQKGRE